MLQMYRMQDIHLEDSNLLEEYYNLFFGNEIDKAHKIISDNPQLSSKVLNENSLNKIVNCINELESWYDEDVTQYLNDKFNEFQFSIDELIYLTDYNNEIQYESFNFVYYNKELYFCIKTPPIGTEPTNSEYWIYLGLKGEKGSCSIGTIYKGNWSSIENYLKNDMVVYKKIIYIARKESTNQEPLTVSEYWMPLINVNERGIYISYPGSQYTSLGDLWMEIFGWGYSSSKDSQDIKLGNQPNNFNIGDFWIELEKNFNSNSNIFISSTVPTYSLNEGDIWFEIPEWVLEEQNLKGIYIANFEPDNIRTGQIWIELL